MQILWQLSSVNIAPESQRIHLVHASSNASTQIAKRSPRRHARCRCRRESGMTMPETTAWICPSVQAGGAPPDEIVVFESGAPEDGRRDGDGGDDARACQNAPQYVCHRNMHARSPSPRSLRLTWSRHAARSPGPRHRGQEYARSPSSDCAAVPARRVHSSEGTQPQECPRACRSSHQAIFVNGCADRAE